MEKRAKPRIVVAEQLSESAVARLEAVGEVVFLERRDEASLIPVVADADALVVRTYSQVTAKVIAAGQKAGRLKVIGRAGVGLDNIDVSAAFEAGIPVVHTPAASTDAVADLTVGLIIALQKQLVFADGQVRKGHFASVRRDMMLLSGFKYQTLGIIGMGRIGQAVSHRLHHGFGLRVCYYDIRDVGPLAFPAECCASSEAVYSQADVVALHVPLTRLTRGLINSKSLKRFKKGSFLVNTSRGPVVEAGPLAEALEQGRIAGAGIDVFDPEPPPPDHPLLSAKNCILTPHIGARNAEGMAAMNDVVDDVIAVLAGQPPMYPAEPEQC